MQKILIVVLLLLAGCETINHSQGAGTLHAKKPAPLATKNKNDLIYNRYKNNHNRYTQTRDNAPKKQKKINFKDPVPTKEPFSRYGNPAQYSVGGHSYKVNRFTTRYKTRGIASWYGTKFHKQRTSSGEPYDMYQMTAAHKTLPLPTYVKVKNLNNGKIAVVKINDRGPFHANRIIDLSYAAALKLGVFPKGTAPVEVETIMGPVGIGHYYLQVGAFSTEILAKQLKEKLTHLSSSPVFIEHYKQRYLVKVGPLGSQAMADNLKHKLVLNGISGSFSVLI